MKTSISMMAAALALGACGETSEPAEDPLSNHAEAGANLLWNELANSADTAPGEDEPAEEESVPQSVATEPAPSPSRASKSEAPSARPEEAPAPRRSEPTAKAPSPEAPSAPSPAPKAECTPEHEAMGHCSR